MTSYDPDKRKLLSILCHASIFLSSTVISVGIPIAIMVVSDDPVVKENAKESLNFHFNVWLYGIIFGILAWVLIGLPLLFVLLIASWIMPILAIIKVLEDPSKSFRYPFIFRLL
jgi:uncharacterized protein